MINNLSETVVIIKNKEKNYIFNLNKIFSKKLYLFLKMLTTWYFININLDKHGKIKIISMRRNYMLHKKLNNKEV